MEFTEQTALEIIAKFDLPKSNLAKWKFRKEIPDKYFNADTSAEVSEKDALYPKVLEVLQLKEIAATKFRTFSERPQRASDIISKKYRMTENEKVLFITEISELRNLLFKVLKVTNEGNIKSVQKDKRLHHTHFINQKIMSRVNALDSVSFSELEKTELRNSISIIYNKLLIK